MEKEKINTENSAEGCFDSAAIECAATEMLEKYREAFEELAK